MRNVNSAKKTARDLLQRIGSAEEMIGYRQKKKLVERMEVRLKDVDDPYRADLSARDYREYSSARSEIIAVENIASETRDLIDFLELCSDEDLDEVGSEISREMLYLKSRVIELERKYLFRGKYDSMSCYVDIQSGSGGLEAQDWSGMLLRMYSRWAGSHGFAAKTVEEYIGEGGGIKSATIKITGDLAYGWLRTEHGVHRLIRKSPFDPGGRRHTSFSAISVYPDIEDDTDLRVKIDASDLRIDVYRSSGAGGQHVNRTESAVRVTHLPTGVVTQCQKNRSQHRNKLEAIKQLEVKLYKLRLSEKNKEKKLLDSLKLDIGWGSQIRSYVLDNPRVKDARTGLEVYDVRLVLDGDLDRFIEASLRAGL